jgi:hypothetical protein
VNGSDSDGNEENNDAHDADGVSSIATIEIASDSVTNSFLLMCMSPSTLDTRLQLLAGLYKAIDKKCAGLKAKKAKKN